MKPLCQEYVRPAQIDTLCRLLEEKEELLQHIMEAFGKQDKTDSLLANHLPEVAKRATRIRTIQQRKKGLQVYSVVKRLSKYSLLLKN